MSKIPKSVKLGNWLMDTKLPIPFKFQVGMFIKYSRLTPDDYWKDLY